MMTKTETFSICFQARRNKRGTRLTVSLRVTINGERWEVTTGCTGAIANWRKSKGQFVGDDAHQNAVLQALKSKVTAIRAELLQSVGYVTKDSFNAAWHKKAQNPGLMEVYAMIVDDKELQQSKGKIIMRSLEAYHRAGQVFAEFLASEQRTDIAIREVDISFARRFQAYLQAQDYAPGYIQKFFVRLRQCLKLAIEKGMIEHSAVLQYKVHKPTPPPPVYLTFDELHRMETTDFSRHDLQLQKAADVLIFCCHTGFSYKDAQNFSRAKHVSSLHGKPWISYPRGKTGTFQELELFPKAAAILDKYGGNQLPRISNQKVNFYLKQIAEICKINKQLTSHIGRKTAGTLWLNSGISYEVVAVMLMQYFDSWSECFDPGTAAIALGKAVTSELCREYDSTVRMLTMHEADHLHALFLLLGKINEVDFTPSAENKKADVRTVGLEIPSPLTAKSERNGKQN